MCFFPSLSSFVLFRFFLRAPELLALMKIKKVLGMPGVPGVIAHGPVEGEPLTH